MLEPSTTELLQIQPDVFVTAEQLGGWLNLASGSITKNAEKLQSSIDAAIQLIENYIWFALRRHTYRALYYVNSYADSAMFLLQRAPILSLDSITKIEYLENNIYVVFDRGSMTAEGLYTNSTENKIPGKWANVYVERLPLFQDRTAAIKFRIEFQAGYDPTEIDIAKQIPADILLAIKQIAAYFYTNRGDCSNTGCTINGVSVPCVAKIALDQYALKYTQLGGGNGYKNYF